MFYVINDYEAATREGLVDTVNCALEKTRNCAELDVVPYTEKGKPSKKYKPFRVKVFNAPEWHSVWVYGLDSCAYNCGQFLHDYFESKGVLVVWRGDGSIYDYQF